MPRVFYILSILLVTLCLSNHCSCCFICSIIKASLKRYSVGYHPPKFIAVIVPPARKPWSTGYPQAQTTVPPTAGVWVNATNGQVPPGAVQGGHDCNIKYCSREALYVARAEHQGALIPGKLVKLHRCAYVAWNGVEYCHKEYQVLVNGTNQWVPTKGAKEPPNAFQGGVTEFGEPLYICRVQHEGSVTTGKVERSHGVCYISFDGKELPFKEYEVLVA